MSSNTIYYVYAYLRNKDSATARAGTPYYIGKGCNKRAWEKHHFIIPKDRSRIVILETNLTELGAVAIERRLIKWWGRKDICTGILENKTNGGDGTSGYHLTQEHKNRLSEFWTGKPGKTLGMKFSDETKEKMSRAHKGREFTPEWCQKISDAKRGKKRSDTPWNKGLTKDSCPSLSTPQTRMTCPHCGLYGGVSGMKRWHFDNCRSKL